MLILIKKKRFIFSLILLVIGTFLIIPIRLAIAFYQTPQPQAILVLGGDSERMKFTHKFAQSHPNLDIWVSDVKEMFRYNNWLFNKLAINKQRLHYDLCPTDTVTNFTCMVQVLPQENIHHVYLITSDYHMDRAKAIAFLIFGSKGIAFTPVAVQSSTPDSESFLRIIRDCFRSLFWLLTGYSGASFNPRLSSK